MATPPDFTAGQILTAAQMNAVGLWLVKEQTIGSAVSSVTVNDAFSADYENYKITISGGVGSTISDFNLKLGATTTGYYYNLVFQSYTAGTISGLSATNAGSWLYTGSITANTLHMDVDIYLPFATKRTTYTSKTSYATTTTGFYTSGGNLETNTSYTSFIVGANGGTITGGTIRVYGYKIG
jgi:hypothetical protein